MPRNLQSGLTQSNRGAPCHRLIDRSFHMNPHAVPLSPHKSSVIASLPYGATWVVGQVVGASQATDNSSLLGAGPPNGLPAARPVGSHPTAHVRRMSKCLPKPPRTGAI